MPASPTVDLGLERVDANALRHEESMIANPLGVRGAKAVRKSTVTDVGKTLQALSELEHESATDGIRRLHALALQQRFRRQ